ncbi:MAG TPA: UDP-N-acetylglucosamine 1-carboxyvinyltransferase [Smithellaceae bacterium]|nr:UDP-N-acetylglucosamine 1-carboxyvinyltransferase [Syntrophaceae bacterium]NMD04442.1 UDP-N-acetylglucosamine 1-carboxyvinyltransferase [Deltaproteobacteria bacterium]HOF77655.1 UDP-N-acetylglucosamine 1-carboxyvinyltransferase [Smithellaceae bacterium]MBP8608847.1 UDP-N-acetylglucosamine 1-carboxyvinyltransferase [Syntrophaceae bacterium]HOM69025.1 UDP-N-acetylglucosamine 1-carboxyvinyltransferase [Smithellaceae bacterium]
MDKIIVQGGKSLHGNVQISGAKNAALPVMAAALLTEGTNTFHNIPDLMDIRTIKKLLRNLGAQIEGEETLQINVDKITSCVAPYELVKTMRASVLVLGPLVARMGVARVSLPGGCAIGARPVNLHIKALEEMGAKIELKEGYIEAKAKKLKGAEIYFDISTVTGTENVMMAATLAQGTTILRNAACEPEVVNLAEVLKGMGAKINGAGTDVIKIEGVTSLKPTEGTIIPDRIEAGTFMIAAGITHGELNIRGCIPEHLEALINKLRDTGMKISPIKGGLKATGTKKINSVDVKTLPYPGFATDLQAQMMAYMSIGSGLSVITETIFENRFMHVSELMRMGADIKIQGNNAIVRGVPELRGAPVMATDLRASASLVLAALVAKGTTEISRVYHLDRGYEQIEKKFSAVGANIKRVAG